MISNTNIPSRVLNFSLRNPTQDLRHYFIKAVAEGVKGRTREPVRVDKRHSKCSYQILDDDLVFHYKVKPEIQERLGLKVVSAQVMRFDTDDYIEPHTDTAFKDCATLTLSLDNGNDSRLFIKNNSTGHDKAMAGYLMPPRTSHAVIQGDYVRYSLVVFLKDF